MAEPASAAPGAAQPAAVQPAAEQPAGWVAVVELPIDVMSLIARVSDNGVGAISTFLGTVRHVNDGRDVTGIEYHAYQPMAARELALIAEETCSASPGLRLAIEHRVGTLGIGDVSVAIAASHARRAPALAATTYVIEALKRRVPIWKCEHYVDGSRAWVDPTTSTAPSMRT